MDYLLANTPLDKLETELKNSDWAPYWKQFAWHIIEENWILPKIVVAVTNCQLATATQFLNWCVAYKLCKIVKGGSYVKTPNGVSFFKKIMDHYFFLLFIKYRDS